MLFLQQFIESQIDKGDQGVVYEVEQIHLDEAEQLGSCKQVEPEFCFSRWLVKAENDYLRGDENQHGNAAIGSRFSEKAWTILHTLPPLC